MISRAANRPHFETVSSWQCPQCGHTFMTDDADSGGRDDAAISAQAREDVLDKLEKSFQCTPNTGRETQYELGFRQGMTHAICEVKSLRRREVRP